MRSFMNQPAPIGSLLMRPGSPESSPLTATTSPETGANTSLAALTDSTTAASLPFWTRRPISGSST
jgi:hypothetical protein